jgi:hypothetical protein
MVLRDLSDSVIEFYGWTIFRSAKSESTDSPASVLNGVTKVTASGITADAIRSDLRKLQANLLHRISLSLVFTM